MSTTRNERLGLIALAIVLALIVALALFNARPDSVERVPVVVEDLPKSDTANPSDTITSSRKTHKKGKSKPKAVPVRNPRDQRVSPQ